MLAYLRKSGCRIFVSGDRFTINNIPDWQTYAYCQENLQKLILIAITESVFKKTPQPIRMQEHDSKCPYCKNYNSYRCPYELNSYKIPHGTFQNGCDKWAESTSIYF